jgi:type II secretory pathway pseudopilin PulG
VARKRTGLTIVELITVIAIIALLVGLLIPALNSVRDIAKRTKQKAQFTTIDLALAAFKSDYGDYPPSEWWAPPPATAGLRDYCGAQKLAEALLGWDLMGFHPDSDWRADGMNGKTYWVSGVEYAPGTYFLYDPDSEIDMNKRKGPYLDLATTSAFTLNELFSVGLTDPLRGDRYVICDSYGVKKVNLANGETVKAGTPILYYKANAFSKSMVNDATVFEQNIYNVRDNAPLVVLGRVKDGEQHPLVDPAVFYSSEGGVIDPKVTARPWPYRPDSYILISAGPDGFYGTGDDIHNF